MAGIFDQLLGRIQELTTGLQQGVQSGLNDFVGGTTISGKGAAYEQPAQPQQAPVKPAPKTQPTKAKPMAQPQAQPQQVQPQAEPANMNYKGPDDVVSSLKDFFASQTPQGEDPLKYYPIMENLEDMVKKGESQRPGAGALMALQSFFESTGGRNSTNLFGTKPGGNVSEFPNLQSAIDYQMGENVLGGGANPNMNILNEEDKTPLTMDRVRRLYDSYDPPGAYLDSLLSAFEQITQNRSN